MKKTLGARIAEQRKVKGMTQLELAEKMGVTDKAVSKWERDLSYPDISSLPHLSEVLEISVDELMQIKESASTEKKSISEITDMIFKCVGLAMGVGVVVLSVLNELDVKNGMVMLGGGLACISISLLNKEK